MPPETRVEFDEGPLSEALIRIARRAKAAATEVRKVVGGGRARSTSESTEQRVVQLTRRVDRLQFSLRSANVMLRRTMNVAGAVSSLRQGPGAAGGLLGMAGRMAGFATPVGLGLAIGSGIQQVIAARIASERARADADRTMAASPMQQSLRMMPGTMRYNILLADEAKRNTFNRQRAQGIVRMHLTPTERILNKMGITTSLSEKEKEWWTKMTNADSIARSLGYSENAIRRMNTKSRTSGGNNDIMQAHRSVEEHWATSMAANGMAKVFGVEEGTTRRKLSEWFYQQSWLDFAGGGPENFAQAVAGAQADNRLREIQNEAAQRQKRFEQADRYFADPTASFVALEKRRAEEFRWQVHRPRYSAVRRD